MKATIKNLIDNTDTKLGRFISMFIQVLILISVVTFSMETIPDLSSQTRTLLRYIEVVCVIIFTIEYLLRIYAAERKFKFIFSFYGIIDFLAILPFYLAIGVDLRSLRALRFLRLFRIFKLVRYNKALNHFSRAIKSAKEQIYLFIFIT